MSRNPHRGGTGSIGTARPIHTTGTDQRYGGPASGVRCQSQMVVIVPSGVLKKVCLKGHIFPFSRIDKEIQTRRAAVLTQLQQLDNNAANKDFCTPASPQLKGNLRPFSLRQSRAMGDSTTNWNRVDLSLVSENDPGNGPSDRPVYIPTGTPYLPQPHTEKKT